MGYHYYRVLLSDLEKKKRGTLTHKTTLKNEWMKLNTEDLYTVWLHLEEILEKARV